MRRALTCLKKFIKAIVVIKAIGVVAEQIQEIVMSRLIAFIILQVFVWSAYSHACENQRFNGFYAGLNAGYGTGDYEFETPGSESIDLEGSGATVGGHVGYNYQCGSLVFGIEGDGAWSGIKDDMGGNAGSFEAETNYLASIRARLGYDAEIAMFYATAGIGFTDTEYTGTEFGVSSVNYSETATGFVVGGGAESMISDTLSLRFEVLHYNFGEVFSAADEFGVITTVDHNPTVFRLGGSIHLN